MKGFSGKVYTNKQCMELERSAGSNGRMMRASIVANEISERNVYLFSRMQLNHLILILYYSFEYPSSIIPAR